MLITFHPMAKCPGSKSFGGVAVAFFLHVADQRKAVTVAFNDHHFLFKFFF